MAMQKTHMSWSCCFRQEMDLIDFAEHNHHPEDDSVISKMERMKSKAKDSADKTINVIINAIGNPGDDVLGNLPKCKSMMKNIQRTKETPGYIPTIPEIPECLWYNKRNLLFLRHDSGINDENRSVFFASDFQLGILEKAKVWIVDGKFKSVLNCFQQLVTIECYFLADIGLVFMDSYPIKLRLDT